MPIFEYKCSRGHITEKLALAKRDLELKTIPCTCGGTATKIDVSHSSFRLMPGGSGGFYSPSKG